ncbi:MAG TPA: glycoside hydrolase family 32 protein [Clostridiales bacterium]|nr:glycoside hydrolase family 32 protein [Clostridiales bacterium]
MKYLICEKLEKSVILFPVSQDGKMINVRILAAGVTVSEQTLRISKKAEMNAVFLIEDHKGEKIELEVFDGQETIEFPDIVSYVKLSDGPEGENNTNILSEYIRPGIHYTCRKGYMNDPNGLLCYKDTYHMFYQWNPYGVTPGNTHWGHCISRDLVHWEELPPAIEPDGEDGCIFSGSGVIDHQNTSGLKNGEEAPILLFYTATGYRFPAMKYYRNNFDDFFWSSGTPYTKQCIAYSIDGGKTFMKYEKNPVLTQRTVLNRDPKVVWDQDNECWIMILFLSGNQYQLFFSRNLLDWEDGQKIEMEDSAECPDLFCLPLDGQQNNRKWVLWGAPGNYQVGYFKDRRFISETGIVKSRILDHLKYGSRSPFGGYAAQTYSGTLKGRVIQTCFITTCFFAAPFRSCMSLPVELELASVHGQMRLKFLPPEELKSLRKKMWTVADCNREGAMLDAFSEEIFEMDLKATLGEDARFVLNIRGTLLIYDRRNETLITPKGSYRLSCGNNSLGLHIWVDRGSIELFSEDGLVYAILAGVWDAGNRDLALIECRDASLSGHVWALETI